jgi:hypothetical protein
MLRIDQITTPRDTGIITHAQATVATFQLLALEECFRKGDFARLKNENCLSAGQSR